MNGLEAVKLVQADIEKNESCTYQVILMDCQMPIMDGYRATEAIREMQGGANLTRTPIVAMTANAMAGDRDKCLDAGMDDYLSKPLNRQALTHTLKKWLRPADELRDRIQAPRPGHSDAVVAVGYRGPCNVVFVLAGGGQVQTPSRCVPSFS